MTEVINDTKVLADRFLKTMQGKFMDQMLYIDLGDHSIRICNPDVVFSKSFETSMGCCTHSLVQLQSWSGDRLSLQQTESFTRTDFFAIGEHAQATAFAIAFSGLVVKNC